MVTHALPCHVAALPLGPAGRMVLMVCAHRVLLVIKAVRTDP